AQIMVKIGQLAGRRVAAVLSSMEQPLGHAVGNALEVREAIAVLRGGGPPDLVELCLVLGTELVLLAGLTHEPDEARAMLQATLANGSAWAKFHAMVSHQGGDVRVIEQPDLLPVAPVQQPLVAPCTGYVATIDGMALGLAVNALGGGRARKEDLIDPAVGLMIQTRVGDLVEAGHPLLTIHAADESAAAQVAPALLAAYHFSDQSVAPPALVEAILR
ncbi:MAG: pyrimidine-nucleoside phosphorylase, partial [Chloroflexia bacterium]|nr:pyrimidine-nucleoside phosphorylase [Chloroflexia bacterium]